MRVCSYLKVEIVKEEPEGEGMQLVAVVGRRTVLVRLAKTFCK